MSPEVFDTFARILETRLPAGSATDTARLVALEVGAAGWTLLAAPALKNARKIALNVRFDKVTEELAQTEMVLGNGNHLDFPDETFDCVMSSSTLEHDKYFWRSTAETRRVLKSGGLFVVGVPIYMTLPTDKDRTTVTYARHGMAYNADFYRFSEQAVREVFFEGYAEIVDEIVVRKYPNPYLVVAGRK